MGGILIDSESGRNAQGFAAYLENREKDGGGDPYIGRKLSRLLHQAGFAVQQMTASYEVITDILKEIGPALAAQFATPGYCSLQDKPDDTLFVALAWCEVIGCAR